MVLSYPPDIDEAYDQWRASCGPCALAALLGMKVQEVRRYLPGVEQRVYCNVTQLKAALDAAGVHYRSIGPRLPKRGLVFVQWSGHDDKPIKVQYRFTHWVAIEAETVFEVNAPELVSWAAWQRVMPKLMQEEGQGDGSYRIRAGLEVC